MFLRVKSRIPKENQILVIRDGTQIRVRYLELMFLVTAPFEDIVIMLVKYLNRVSMGEGGL